MSDNKKLKSSSMSSSSSSLDESNLSDVSGGGLFGTNIGGNQRRKYIIGVEAGQVNPELKEQNRREEW